jgi:hypothetical protein
MLPVILPVQFEHVERIQEHLLVVDIGMQLVEIRLAIPVCLWSGTRGQD